MNLPPPRETSGHVARHRRLAAYGRVESSHNAVASVPPDYDAPLRTLAALVVPRKAIGNATFISRRHIPPGPYLSGARVLCVGLCPRLTQATTQNIPQQR